MLTVRYLLVLFVSLFLSAATSVAARAQEEDERAWYQRLELDGDLRLRYEGFQQEGAFDNGRRDRFRYRLRLGFEVEVHEAVRLGVKFRSGDPRNPVSDNQSFDGGFNKDVINIAEAFAGFAPSRHVSVIAGKFGHRNLWASSDLQWDDDVVVEGFMQRLSAPLGSVLDRIDLTTYQLVLEESSGSPDAWLFGFQLRPRFQFRGRNELTLGAGYSYYKEPQTVVALSDAGRLTGNEVTHLRDDRGSLLSDFRILDSFAIFRNRKSRDWPLRVSLFYYKNFGALERVEIRDGAPALPAMESGNDTALFARFEIGRSDQPGKTLFRYTRYLSDPDALFYAYMQSDSGRSSNLEGHRIDFRVGTTGNTHVNVTWYHTNPRRGEDTAFDRWQFDYIMSF